MNRHLGYCLVACFSYCFIQPVLAAEAAADDSDGTVLQEIIVTAQRRAQNIQEVPVSVTAFKAEDLQRSGVVGAAQYLAMTPNVGYSEDSSTGSRGVNVSIRGVSDLKTGENSVIPSIGEYLNGFSVASSPSGLYNPQMADLDQVEVLRGPQGTYFGRNSLGGALNLTTKKPTDQFEGYVTGNFTDFNGPGIQESGTAVVNIPLMAGLKTRNVLYYEDSTGIVRNINPDGAGTGHTYWMGRNETEWDIDDHDTLNTTVIYDHENQGGDESVPSGVLSIDTVDGYSLGVTGLTHAVNAGTGFWPNNTTLTSHDLPEHTDIRQVTGIANFSHQFTDAVALKAVGGLLHGSINRLLDEDGVGGWNNFYRAGQDYGQSYSGEVRLEVNTKPFTWVAGFIYANDSSTINEQVLAGSDTNAPLTENGPGPGGAVLLPKLPDGLCFLCDIKHFDDRSEAFFTEATYRPIEQIELIAGGRYTHDDVKSTLETYGPVFGAPGYGPKAIANGDVSFNNFAPKIGIGYKMSEDVHYYATVSEGYKAGGTSLGFNPSPATVPLPAVISTPFKPEKLWSYEAGMKTEWLDHRLRINADAFYLRWTDLQLEVFRFLVPGDLSSKFALTTNFPGAQAHGGEIEFAAAVARGFSLMGSAGYLDSEITDSGTQQLSGGFLVNLHGLPMPNSPHFTANLGAEERWSMRDNSDGWVRFDYVHRGSQYSNVEALVWRQIRGQYLPSHANNSAFLPATANGFPFRVPSYDIFNLSGGYDWKSFEAILSVQNLLGKEYYTGTAESYSLSGIRLKPHPRAVGLTVTYKFGK